MSGLIPQSFIDDLLARTDIVGVVESRVPLKRAGRNWMACCPFHKEKTPSFTVSPDKQFYYCFGCGATGNAIGFLMDYERRSFPEAVEELAGRAGLTVPHDSGGDEAQQSRFRALYDLLGQADRYYQQQLRRHALRARAVDYLKGRGLTGEIARRFGLGYAPPGWDNLLAALGTDDSKRAQLTECGLLIAQDERTYDRFRDRVMFPIRDLRGRVIGFGGRVIGDGKPKYLNSPETPVFHKGRELYGLYEAKQTSRTLERLLVVEGYMDVIALAQQGIGNAVATLGTACTADHVDLLFRHANEIVFCFDGDAAGRKAAWRALETTLPKMQDGRSARVLFLPDGHDPDSLVRAEGPDAFNARLDRADSLDDVLLAQLASQVDLARSDGLARLAALARPYVAQIPGDVLRSLVIGKLADLTHVDPRLLAGAPPARTPGRYPEDHRPQDNREPDDEPPPWGDMPPDAPPARGRRPVQGKPRRGTPRPVSAAGHIVRRLLLAPELGRDFTLLPELRGLEQPDVALLCEVLDILHDSEYPSVAALFGRLRGSDHEEALADLAGREFLEGGPHTDAGLLALRGDIAGGLRQLELAWLDDEISRELRKAEGPDGIRLRELLARQQELKSALHAPREP
ncbi:MAG: DNA primase [Gammaproteobacteria bacterium]